ncbi:hypothetical protein L1987_82076 [Smallanthus sonchifolius]|uniref:Uncharacterized protein n=1 Tax=Smallanthus sonchifolius TaxID=185202 RepID=A0ACB8YRH7_9ASTR|nr:hypothetical protein L1987_82076 [Smallanthus sonchifolius]
MDLVALQPYICKKYGHVKKTLLRLFSSCPLLKRLTINCDFGTITYSGDSTIADLMECLPGIEYLCVWCYIFLSFLPLPKELPTKLFHLKYLCMEYVILSRKNEENELVFVKLILAKSPVL